MTTGSICIVETKDTIESILTRCDVEFDTNLYGEDEGYCYNIVTRYASVLFSDSTDTGELTAFALDNSMINWANREGLSSEQIADLNCFIPLNSILEVVTYLSTQKLKPICIHD